MSNFPRRAAAALALLATLTSCAQDVVRHKVPGSDFPIAMAVERARASMAGRPSPRWSRRAC